MNPTSLPYNPQMQLYGAQHYVDSPYAGVVAGNAGSAGGIGGLSTADLIKLQQLKDKKASENLEALNSFEQALFDSGKNLLGSVVTPEGEVAVKDKEEYNQFVNELVEESKALSKNPNDPDFLQKQLDMQRKVRSYFGSGRGAQLLDNATKYGVSMKSYMDAKQGGDEASNYNFLEQNKKYAQDNSQPLSYHNLATQAYDRMGTLKKSFEDYTRGGGQTGYMTTSIPGGGAMVVKTNGEPITTDEVELFINNRLLADADLNKHFTNDSKIRFARNEYAKNLQVLNEDGTIDQDATIDNIKKSLVKASAEEVRTTYGGSVGSMEAEDTDIHYAAKAQEYKNKAALAQINYQRQQAELYNSQLKGALLEKKLTENGSSSSSTSSKSKNTYSVKTKSGASANINKKGTDKPPKTGDNLDILQKGEEVEAKAYSKVYEDEGVLRLSISPERILEENSKITKEGILGNKENALLKAYDLTQGVGSYTKSEKVNVDSSPEFDKDDAVNIKQAVAYIYNKLYGSYGRGELTPEYVYQQLSYLRLGMTHKVDKRIKAIAGIDANNNLNINSDALWSTEEESIHRAIWGTSRKGHTIKDGSSTRMDIIRAVSDNVSFGLLAPVQSGIFNDEELADFSSIPTFKVGRQYINPKDDGALKVGDDKYVYGVTDENKKRWYYVCDSKNVNVYDDGRLLNEIDFLKLFISNKTK